MSTEYNALVVKVEGFTAATFARRRSDMACKAGCDACCHAWLSVSPVEAAELRRGLSGLDAEQREAIATRGRLERAREARGERDARCAMLDATGACSVYAQRPLVCRTQGHALRYPQGLIPLSAVRAKASAGSGDITYCPLNFTASEPRSGDVLDAERVDQMLAIVNHRFALANGADPAARHPISELAAEADMLGCP